MSPGPIPFSSLDAYARRHGFDDPDDFEMLRLAVRALDAVFLDDLRSKGEQAG